MSSDCKLLRLFAVFAVLSLVASGCFSWTGSGGSGDDDDAFGDDDFFGDDDDTGGSGDDDDTGATGDDDSSASGDDDSSSGPGDDDTSGSGDDDDTSGGPIVPGDDDDSALEGYMSLGAPEATAFAPLSVGQVAELPFRIFNGSDVFVVWNVDVQVSPNNGNGTVFLMSGGTTTGSISPHYYEQRDLVFSPQQGISYTAELRLFHDGINVDGSAGVGPDGVYPSSDDIPATLSFTANAQTSSESDCVDGIDNDLDGDIDCADSDCDTICPCGECCDDTIDNDGDGDIDCADSDCSFDPNCRDFCCDVGGDQNTYLLCHDPTCAQDACNALPSFGCCSGDPAIGGWFVECRDNYAGCVGNCPPP